MADESRLTILFDAPFWVGVYERTEDGRYTACKVTFGGEPKDCEVYEFFLKNWRRLKFSPPIQAEGGTERRISPKRMQREISSQTQNRGIGTKAQQALQLQREQGRRERALRGRTRSEAEKARKFALRQEKKRAKRRGKRTRRFA